MSFVALETALAIIEKTYGPPASAHECLGVIAEEYMELTQAVQKNSAERIAAEAFDVAVSAYRLYLAAVAPRDDIWHAAFRSRSNL